MWVAQDLEAGPLETRFQRGLEGFARSLRADVSVDLIVTIITTIIGAPPLVTALRNNSGILNSYAPPDSGIRDFGSSLCYLHNSLHSGFSL